MIRILGTCRWICFVLMYLVIDIWRQSRVSAAVAYLLVLYNLGNGTFRF